MNIACMAIYWPTPEFKRRLFKLCVLSRWDFTFCVRTSLPTDWSWTAFGCVSQHDKDGDRFRIFEARQSETALFITFFPRLNYKTERSLNFFFFFFLNVICLDEVIWHLYGSVSASAGYVVWAFSFAFSVIYAVESRVFACCGRMNMIFQMDIVLGFLLLLFLMASVLLS